MTCERFREIVFREASLKYYQFVSRDLIENSKKSYKNLGNLILSEYHSKGIPRLTLRQLVDQAMVDQVIARENEIKGRLTAYAKKIRA
jgi:hypothetical protein